MSVEEVFVRVLGRKPSEEERERLGKLRDALGLRDNDAFWCIVMALEHYDAWFREYPRKLAEETRSSIEQARAAFAVAAENEAAHVQRVLSEKVAETSVQIARKLAERPVGLHRITLVLSCVVAFGALCVDAGYTLRGTERPFWVGGAGAVSGAQQVLSVMLAVPAGWMIFALLMPAAAHGARVGWRWIRESDEEGHQKLAGWSLVALSTVGAVALAVLLAKVV